MPVNYYDVADNYSSIRIKFAQTIKLSSITNDRFTLYSNGSTPVLTPFADIDLVRDYNTISRILTLYFKSVLVSDTSYLIRVNGLLGATGAAIAEDIGSFTSGTIEGPYAELPPDNPPVEIKDKSIQSRAFLTSETIVQTNPDFYIVVTDPEDQSILIPTDYENGRVTVEFSKRPAPLFISEKYIKAQRKKVERAPSRWESLSVEVSLDSDEPKAYIDFPSTDATPVYNTADHIYFEDGYKYRVKFGKEIGV